MSKLFDALNNLEARESRGQEAVHYLTEKQGDKGRRKPAWALPLLVLLFFVAAGLGFSLSLGLLKTRHAGVAAGFDPGRPLPVKTDAAIPVMPATPAVSAIVDDKKDIKNNVQSDAGPSAVPDIDMSEAGHSAQQTVPAKGKNKQEKTGSEENRTGKTGEDVSNGDHELALPPSHEFIKNEPALTCGHLLQQAEEYRAAGRMEDAAGLYRTVWVKTGDARVANNLAAALLVLGRVKEAEIVLSEAIKKAPDDMDLKFNLDFTRRKLAQADHD